MTDKFAYIRIRAPSLSDAAIGEIKRWMDWEDNSWRSVMGTEPPWLKTSSVTRPPSNSEAK